MCSSDLEPEVHDGRAARGHQGGLDLLLRRQDAALLIHVVEDLADDVEGAHEVGAATYVTGTAAREYLDENEFFVRNINIEWVDYSKLPSDPSLPEGAPEVSIIDTLLRCDEACCIQLSTFSE